jgi:hypothetical protein
VNQRFIFLIFVLVYCHGGTVWSADDESGDTRWDYGVKVTAGYFNFRNSLYVDIGPDPPGNLGEDWTEFAIKPHVGFERDTSFGAWFGEASWAYARTGDDASEISGGRASSTDFDNLYLGWRYGSVNTGQFEIAGGRYPYQIANGLLLADGYADGGSRGALWTNPRMAWAPGGRLQYRHSGHTVDVFYRERDDRPEWDGDIRLSGVNYEWQSAARAWTLGASYLKFRASELEQHLDGADVWNFRVYTSPFSVPLTIEAEWVSEDNGLLLDSTAWYIQPFWTWKKSPWQPTLYYRYAVFEGDDPDTLANEDFDPLFPAFHDWGSWWQGEIAGEYFLANSNLKTHMLRLHMSPRDTIGTGVLYFDYALDQPGSFAGGVSSDKLAREINWYMDWKVNRMFTFSFVLARNNPGPAVEEAYGRTKSFKYGMIFLAFEY